MEGFSTVAGGFLPLSYHLDLAPVRGRLTGQIKAA